MKVRALAWLVCAGCAVSGAHGGDGPLPEDADMPTEEAPHDGGSDATDEDPERPTCTPMLLTPAPAPLELYIVLDRSVAMQSDDKYALAEEVLIAFADSPHPSELTLALNLSPAPLVSDACSPRNYRYPLVPMQPASTFGLQLGSTVERYEAWGGDDPLVPALAGGLEYMAARAREHAGSARALLLLSEGMEQSCGGGFEALAETAGAGQQLAEPLPTYVLGFAEDHGESFNGVAAQGGTDRGMYMGVGAGAVQEGTRALSTMRDRILRCEYEVPTLVNAQIDAKRVRLQVQRSDSTTPAEHWELRSGDACAQGELGFRYDRPREPRRIQLCPAACARLRENEDLQVALDMACVWTVQ